MSDRGIASAYAGLLDQLRTAILQDWAWPSPEAGFVRFVFHDSVATTDLVLPGMEWPTDEPLTHAPALAAAGYALACGECRSQTAQWLAGLKRLSSREAFPSDRQSFAYRPLEALGIAAGLASLNGEGADLRPWLKDILGRTRSLQSDDWAKCLQAAAEFTMQLPGGSLPLLGTMPQRPEDIAVMSWTAERYQKAADLKSAAASLLERCALEPLGQLDLARSAVLYRILRATVRTVIASEMGQYWDVNRTRKDAEMLVTRLCRRFHLFAEQLKVRHDGRQTVAIADEYDVQDLLHAMLRLHFEDVRPEEGTPSTAGKSARMDFLLKPEKIVVETKMTRKGLDQKKVGDELIIDLRRYRAHPDVKTLICMVYDPGGLCGTPAALEADLTGTFDGIDCIVAVCPHGL